MARTNGSTRIPDRAIQQELDRIMSSATFQAVDRLRLFLQFIVTETAAGRGDAGSIPVTHPNSIA